MLNARRWPCSHTVVINRRAWPGTALIIADCVACKSTVALEGNYQLDSDPNANQLRRNGENPRNDRRNVLHAGRIGTGCQTLPQHQPEKVR